MIVTHLKSRMTRGLRWWPLQRAIYRSFVARSELVWSRHEDPALRHDAFGMYARFRRRWFAGGGRTGRSVRGRPASATAASPRLLTFWPSEYNQVRGQYRRTRYGDDNRVANELFLQLLFTIGAHGAHAF